MIKKKNLYINIDLIKNIFTVIAPYCTFAEFTKLEDFKKFIKENNLKLKYDNTGWENSKHYKCISEGEI